MYDFERATSIWLSAHLLDDAGTVLVDEQVTRFKRRDGIAHFHLQTTPVSTPAGLPLVFTVHLSMKGLRLAVESGGAELMYVEPIGVFTLARLRLPTDEMLQIRIFEKRTP